MKKAPLKLNRKKSNGVWSHDGLMNEGKNDVPDEENFYRLTKLKLLT